MSCPPVQFLDQDVLNTVQSCIRENGTEKICSLQITWRFFNQFRLYLHFSPGIFVLNLVCRDEKLRDQVLNDLKKTFKSVVSYKLDEDVNEILYCQNVEYDSKRWCDAMEKSAKHLNELLKKEQNYSEIIEVQEFLEQLKVWIL